MAVNTEQKLYLLYLHLCDVSEY